MRFCSLRFALASVAPRDVGGVIIGYQVLEALLSVGNSLSAGSLFVKCVVHS